MQIPRGSYASSGLARNDHDGVISLLALSMNERTLLAGFFVLQTSSCYTLRHSCPLPYTQSIFFESFDTNV